MDKGTTMVDDVIYSKQEYVDEGLNCNIEEDEGTIIVDEELNCNTVEDEELKCDIEEDGELDERTALSILRHN